MNIQAPIKLIPLFATFTAGGHRSGGPSGDWPSRSGRPEAGERRAARGVRAGKFAPISRTVPSLSALTVG